MNPLIDASYLLVLSAVDQWTPPPMVGKGWCRDKRGYYKMI